MVLQALREEVNPLRRPSAGGSNERDNNGTRSTIEIEFRVYTAKYRTLGTVDDDKIFLETTITLGAPKKLISTKRKVPPEEQRHAIGVQQKQFCKIRLKFRRVLR